MAIVEEVRKMISLLMKRPITEAIALEVEATEGFEHLEIEDGEWVGFDEDEYMGGEQHGWLEMIVGHAFTDWVLANRTGRTYPGDTDFVLEGTPGNIILNAALILHSFRKTTLSHQRGMCTVFQTLQ